MPQPSTPTQNEKLIKSSTVNSNSRDSEIAYADPVESCLSVNNYPGPHSAIHLVTHDSQVTPKLSTLRTILLAGSIMSTNFLGAASTGSVTLLVPTIAKALGKPVLQAQWLSSAFALSFVCGLLFSGRLADIYGKRTLFKSGLFIYAVFAIVTGTLKNIPGLVTTRALSGLGLSIASPAGFGIIGVHVLHEPARSIVFAMIGLGVPLGGVSGNFIGGAMAGISKNGWSYLFFLLSGLAIFLLIAAFFIVPSDPPPAPDQDRRIDWIGGALVTSAICLFTFSLTYSGMASKGWSSPNVYALLATSIALLAAFVAWSLHLEHRTSYPPILKMSLFTRTSGLISINCLCNLFISLCIYGWIYTSAIFYQDYKMMTPFGNAIATLPNAIAGTVSALTVVFIASRVRAPYLIGGGSLLTVACCILYAARPEGTVFWAMEFPAQLLQSWGIVYTVGLGNIMMSALVKQHEQSIGGALFQLSGQAGAALGICLASLICSQVEASQGNVLAGIRAAYAFSAACGLVVTIIAGFGLRKVGLAKDVAQM